jgi:mannose-1-phosphate guanylyltransferase/mannose-6-phosphate isomerase
MVIAEPEGRNTAPAVALAALTADADDTLVVFPADHVVEDRAAFVETLEVAIEHARRGHLVTFGIVPSHPATGYGYIRASGDGQVEDVEEFVEKPDSATAERYVASGLYRWNSGMFVFPVALLLDEMEEHCPEVLAGVRQALADAHRDEVFVYPGKAFAQVPSISIDHALMEHTERAAVVALDAGWTDVGSWDALWDLEEKDSDMNVLGGDVLVHDTSGSLIRAESRTVAVVGLSDVAVIETEDAVLVARMSRVQDVKEIVEKLRDEGRNDLT